MKKLRMPKFSFLLILVISLIQFTLCQDLQAKERSTLLARMEGQTFRADSGKIRSVATSPDGKLTAISDSAEVKIWNGNEYIAWFDARQVNTLTFSPDGQYLIGGGNRYIYVWDIYKRKKVQSINAHENLITALAISQNGKMLASGSKGSDPVIMLWAWNGNKIRLKQELRWNYQYSEQVLALTFSSDGSLLASASLDQKTPVRIWNTQSYNDMPIRFQHGTVKKLTFSPDNTLLLAGLNNGKILKIAYQKSGSDRFSIYNEHTQKIADIGFTLNGEYFLSGDVDGNLIYWDTSNWRVAKTISIEDNVSSLLISNNVGVVAVINKKNAALYSLPDSFEPKIEIKEDMQLVLNNSKDKKRDLFFNNSMASSLIKGIVSDESKIKKVLINDIEAKLIKPSPEERVQFGIKGQGMIFAGGKNLPSDLKMVEVVAYDIFNNKTVDFVKVAKTVVTKKIPNTYVPPIAEPAVLSGFGNYYALVIGNNDYKYIADLKTAKNDANVVAQILTDEFGFETELILNATRSDILGALNQYRKTLKPDDNLLIYYAGHGHFDKEADKAYWLPIDAERDDTTNWIIADNITTSLKKISSDHILLVADSCFSGMIASRGLDIDLGSAEARDRYLKRMLGKKSRTIIASGGNEPVSDGGGNGHSVFADVFISSLKEMDGKVFTANELFEKQNIEKRIIIRSDQTPGYNDIKKAGHDFGDFVFTRIR